MGALCCCPRMDDVDEFTTYPTGSMYQQCFCFRCCLRVFLRMYGALFHSTDGRDLVSAMQTIGAPSSGGLLIATALDTSPDTYRAPPRPIPYDVDPRYVRLQQRDGLVSRREKVGMSQLLGGESEPLRRNNSDDGEQLMSIQRRNSADYDGEAQGFKPDSPGKHQQSTKPMGRVESMMSLGEDEDVCPTCLDGYTKENPKISTQCGHHFHLGCIYEWMERSQYCPVCDKEMIFNETP